MSFTYDETVSWTTPTTGIIFEVRFHMDDRDPDSFIVHDEEIQNALTSSDVEGAGKPYTVAAELLEVKLLSLASVGEGVSRREIDDFEEEFGLGPRGQSAETISTLIESLRIKGSRLVRGPNVVFRAIGGCA